MCVCGGGGGSQEFKASMGTEWDSIKTTGVEGGERKKKKETEACLHRHTLKIRKTQKIIAWDVRDKKISIWKANSSLFFLLVITLTFLYFNLFTLTFLTSNYFNYKQFKLSN